MKTFLGSFDSSLFGQDEATKGGGGGMGIFYIKINKEQSKTETRKGRLDVILWRDWKINNKDLQ